MHLVVVFLLLTLSRQERKRDRHYSQLPPVSVSLSQSSGSSFQSCSDSVSTKTKATQFVVRAVVRIFTGCSVGKISILSFRVGPSKNKNADHRVKETSAVMSIQVTHETDLTAFPVETGRKLNVHKTFNLRPVSTGYSVIQRCQMR